MRQGDGSAKQGMLAAVSKRKKTQRKDQQPRRGRELEKLVALLEQVLGPAARIQSPAHIPDLDTGELREVDVSIRMRVGSTEVLIIGECRDRKAVQDATWIEQLAEKARSVGAARAIAVSRSGFYVPAITKAKVRGVEVRQLTDMTPASVLDAVRVAGFQLYVGRSHIHDGAVKLGADPRVTSQPLLERELATATALLTDGCFVRTSDGLRLSLVDLWHASVEAQKRLPDGVDIYKGVPGDGTRVRRRFAVDNLIPGSVVLPLANGVALPVLGIQMDVALWYEVDEIAPAAAYGYGEPGTDVMVETVEYHLDLRRYGGGQRAVALHHDKTSGRMELTYLPLDEKPVSEARWRVVARDDKGGTKV